MADGLQHRVRRRRQFAHTHRMRAVMSAGADLIERVILAMATVAAVTAALMGLVWAWDAVRGWWR